MTTIDALWTAPAARFADSGAEMKAIAQAQAGDGDAQLALFSAYVPHLRSIVARYTGTLGRDDARQAAFEGLLAAVHAFDPAVSNALASLLPTHVNAALAATASESARGFTVPERSLKRFFGILSRADGDVSAAAKLAPAHHMTVETFHTILAAVTTDSYETVATSEDDPGRTTGGRSVTAEVVTVGREFADIEDRLMVDIALRAVSDLEACVCRHAYGFHDYGAVQTDAEVGHRLGMGRVKTLRTRQAALARMRDALGA